MKPSWTIGNEGLGRWAIVVILLCFFAGSANTAPTIKADPPAQTTYRNPVLFADYSDPDAIRVGDDFYLVASSFSSVPGLPILHSKDLINWSIIGHAAPRLPSPTFDTPQHGKGIWAPSLRHHAGLFWIYVGDPDQGIYVTTARDPRGPWSPLALVKPVLGAIDPCPLWDEDGKIYLVHAWAKSRAGFNSVLTVTPLSADGLHTDGKDVQVFDGHAAHPTIEGPKFYKRNGWYYIFAPAGGVATGWQTVLRSKNVLGPYEDRIVLRQGRSAVNGPHQGAWVDTPNGDSWFFHFQDRGAYGRIVHLQPMTWKSDWPVMGDDPDGDGTGEPVETFRKPTIRSGAALTSAMQTSDDFAAKALGLQWQWNANPRSEWMSLSARPGWLRLSAVARPQGSASVFGLGNLLLQKFPAESFTVTARLDLAGLALGERAGLVIAGRDTASISVVREAVQLGVRVAVGRKVDKDGVDVDGPITPIQGSTVWLRARIEKAEQANPAEATPPARFAFSTDGVRFQDLGDTFLVQPGVWVGARIGLIASAPASSETPRGHIDVDWFRISETH
ncbi:MAG: glycoside hydrolase 43 family protein [Vicinamibacteria bacterium]